MSSEDLPLPVAAYLAINTDGLVEGSVNLFFTNSRSRSAISLTGSPSYLTYNSTTGIFNSVYDFNQNLLTSSSPSFNGLTIGALSGVLKATAGLVSGSATTLDLPENGNLYYTAARFNTAFAAKTTLDLAESGNLYFTNTRAQNAISLTGSPSYLTYISGVFNSVYDFNQNLLITSSPTFNALTLTTALPVSSGGTGQSTYTNGQLLIGNTTGNTLTKATLTAGSSNISITNGTGSITLDTSLTPTLSTLTLNGSAPNLTLSNGTSNMINFGTNGVAAPSFTTRSAGTKLILYNALSGTTVDSAIGIEGSNMWFSVLASGDGFKWYTAATCIARLTSTLLDLGNNGSVPGYLGVTANGNTESISMQFKRTGNAATHYMRHRIHSAGNNYISYNLYNGSTNATSVIITPVGITCGTSITIDNSAALRVYGYQNFGNSYTAAIPAVTTRSTGTCIVIRDALSGSAVDYALGYETDALWYSVAQSTKSHKWYAGTTNIATLGGTGTFYTAAGHTLNTGGITLNQANQTISGSTGLTLQQTGDSYGTTRLYLQNRVGVNGAMFEQAGSVDLVDFVFKGLANQRNIRYENRASPISFVLAPEFQIGTAGSMNCVIADNILAIKHEFRIYSSTSSTNYIAFRCNTSSGNYTLTYPAATGSANQFLYTDGSGILAWTGLSASDANSNLTYSAFTYTLTTTPTFSTVTINGSAPNLTFSNATSNMINFGQNGVAAPTFTTRSAGTKLILYSNLSGSTVDYGFGIENLTLWSSVSDTSGQFKWYGGTTLAMQMTGTGVISTATWQGNTVGVAYGGTGQTTYTNGQLLIGNTTGNTLTKATLTGSSNITVTNGTGSITLDTIQNITTSSQPAFQGLNLVWSSGTPFLDFSASGADFDCRVIYSSNNLYFNNTLGTFVFQQAVEVVGTLLCDTSLTIDAVSIGATALEYCNDINQQLTTTSTPTFGGLLVTSGGFTKIRNVTTATANPEYTWEGKTYAYSMYMDDTFDALTFVRTTGGNSLLGYFSGTSSFQLNVPVVTNSQTGMQLNNGTSNLILFNTTAGVAAPTFTSRSAGCKIALYPSLSGSAVDYGFGIDAATLWSAVDTTASSFKWYGGTTLALTLTGTGNLTTVGDIKMPTSGGTAGALNYYEEYTATLSFSGGAFTGSQNVACKINRIGKAITFTMDSLTVAASGTSTAYNTAASTIPSRLVPAYTLQIPMRVMDNSAGILGLLLIQTDGTVAVYFNINGTTTNTNSGNCGHYPISVSYCL